VSYAIIGGSGLYKFDGLEILEQKNLNTPFGEPSDVVTTGKLGGETIYFLPRHGAKHHLPPHKVNYRANIYALKTLGVEYVIGVNAVGGVVKNLVAGDIVIPHQIIDYTYGREHTYSDGINNTVVSGKVEHIDFTEPFNEFLRNRIISAAKIISLPLVPDGVYGCTQGPRLETAAEIQRLANDGCTLVGMTAMPEAALARELGLSYASISIVANLAAGLSEIPLTVEDIHAVVANGLEQIQQLIKATVVDS